MFMVAMLAACRGTSNASPDGAPGSTAATSVAMTSEPAVDPTAPDIPQASGGPSSRPRYLRANRKGVLVDAFSFGTVPASTVEQEVSAASKRQSAAHVLRRFGLAALEGHTGELWIAKASLVDDLPRERILFASFRGETRGDGSRDEDTWIVFLGSTKDDRVLKVGNARVTARTSREGAVDVTVQALHTEDTDDVVATWSSCVVAGQKGCFALRAWTLQRGYPEQIADVTGDSKPLVRGDAPAPRDIVVDGRALRFDGQAFVYR